MNFDGDRIIYKTVMDNGSKKIGMIILNENKNNNNNNNDNDNDIYIHNKGRIYGKNYDLKWTLPHSKKDYWGFQINDIDRDKIVYVSNQNIIKVYSIKLEKVIYKLVGHRKYIVSILFINKYIISISSNNELKIWYIDIKYNELNNNPINNQRLILNINTIPGNFIPGYLYLIKFVDNIIYYTSDNAIYALKLNDNKLLN